MKLDLSLKLTMSFNIVRVLLGLTRHTEISSCRHLHTCALHHQYACTLSRFDCFSHRWRLKQDFHIKARLQRVRQLSSSHKLCVSSTSSEYSSASLSQSNSSTIQPEEWSQPFQLPVPEIDWDYLLNKDNTDYISSNIQNRKGIGDIHKLISLNEQYSKETNDTKRDELQKQMVSASLELPNSCHPETVIGDESCARTKEIVGEKKALDMKARNVSELAGKGLKMLREKNLTFATGSKTYYLEGDLARLERALVAYTVDHLMDKGFEVISVPDLLYSGVINGCGFNTDVHTSQVYHLHDDCLEGACLAGTAEMSLAGYFMNEVIPLKQLPKRVAAVSRCYRAEADTKASEKGLYRVHHFTKVEMFGLTANEDGTESDQLLDDFLAIERELFSNLGLYFRILDMPSQELGAPAYRKYDIEAWMDGKKIWGEISSCSNCTDYQSRRLNIKYQTDIGSLRHVHTVNGTACAVPRMITALLEQNQQKGRQLSLPEALHPYMNGQTHLAFNLKNFPYTYIKSLRQVSS